MFDERYGCLAVMALFLSAIAFVIGIAYLTDPTTDPFRKGKAASAKIGVKAEGAAKVCEAEKRPTGGEKPTVCCFCGGEKGAIVCLVLGPNGKLEMENLAGMEKLWKRWLLGVAGQELASGPQKPSATDADGAEADIGDFDEALGKIGIADGVNSDSQPGRPVKVTADEKEDAQGETDKCATRADVDGKQDLKSVFHAGHHTRNEEERETP